MGSDGSVVRRTHKRQPSTITYWRLDEVIMEYLSYTQLEVSAAQGTLGTVHTGPRAEERSPRCTTLGEMYLNVSDDKTPGGTLRTP